MRRDNEDAALHLLASCCVLLCTEAGPRGTAFFVAPGYAITAAHVVDGTKGLTVQLSEGRRTWSGLVIDVCPPHSSGGMSTYPAPDLALIALDDDPAHTCALLSRQLPAMGARVMARGYTHTFDREAVTAEIETFHLSGMLETPDPGCTLLKLGLGEVTKGMSGAPVLDLDSGHVIGMLRTSRQLGSNLGGWVVPADLIRQLWPEEVDQGNDLFHQQDASWHREGRQLDAGIHSAPPQGGLAIGMINADVAPVINGGIIDNIHIENHAAYDRRRRATD